MLEGKLQKQERSWEAAACTQQLWEKKVGAGPVYWVCTVGSKLIMDIRGGKKGHAEKLG